MRVFNIMMSRCLGGIQQAYIDYNDALSMQGHDVINITSSFAKINKKLFPTHRLPNLVSWCSISKIYLKLLLIFYKPDAIICHGNRAISFSIWAKIKNIPIIGVSHNYTYKYLQKCDYVLTITEELKNYLIENDFEEKKLFSIPNMIRIKNIFQSISYKSPIIIGSFGRFVEKKGFIYLIQALKLLRRKNLDVKLILGGDGEEKESLLNEVENLNLKDYVSFEGWVHNKSEFFSKIDIFCLPSISEPFGIILLEAMEYSKPIIATYSGGPSEIIRNGTDGLLINIESSEELADALESIIANEEFAFRMAKSAYDRLENNYDIKIISQKLSKILYGIKNEF